MAATGSENSIQMAAVGDTNLYCLYLLLITVYSEIMQNRVIYHYSSRRENRSTQAENNKYKILSVISAVPLTLKSYTEFMHIASSF